MEAFWAFLKDPSNQSTLAWIGGGVVVLAGGVWAVVKQVSDKPAKPSANPPAKPTVEASNGGIAVGGGVENSTLTTGQDAKTRR